MPKIDLSDADVHNILAAIHLAIKHPDSKPGDIDNFVYVRQSILAQVNAPTPVEDTAKQNGHQPERPLSRRERQRQRQSQEVKP